jgi:hypothetical protein
MNKSRSSSFLLSAMDKKKMFCYIFQRIWRRTQAAKGVDCKSIIQRFESARRLKKSKDLLR